MSQINWLDLLGWGSDVIDDLRLAGYSYIKQGHYSAALAFFEALVTLKKDEAYDLQVLGALYLELGNNLSALNYLEKALQLNVKHEPTLLNRAKALLLLGYKKQGLSQAKNLQESSDVSRILLLTTVDITQTVIKGERKSLVQKSKSLLGLS